MLETQRPRVPQGLVLLLPRREDRFAHDILLFCVRSNKVAKRDRALPVQLVARHGQDRRAAFAVGHLQQVGGGRGGGFLRGGRRAGEEQDRLRHRDQSRSVGLGAQQSGIDHGQVEARADMAELIGKRRAARPTAPRRIVRGQREERQAEPLVGDHPLGELGAGDGLTDQPRQSGVGGIGVDQEHAHAGRGAGDCEAERQSAFAFALHR